jgi:hypothetical protein
VCEYSGQILSYQKMLGQLQDAGNTTTLVHYLDRNREVDFVLCQGDAIVAMEVKRSARCQTLPGTEAFCRHFHVKRRLLVGGQGIPFEEFLSTPAGHWLE